MWWHEVDVHLAAGSAAFGAALALLAVLIIGIIGRWTK